MKICQGYRGYISGNSGWPGPREAWKPDEVMQREPNGYRNRRGTWLGQHVWVAGFCGLSEYLCVYANALGKLPILCIVIVPDLKAHSAILLVRWGPGPGSHSCFPTFWLPHWSESPYSSSSGPFDFHTGNKIGGYCCS